MSEDVQTPSAAEGSMIRRRGRVLIGWMGVDEASSVLAGGQVVGPDRADLRAQIESAHKQVAGRPAGVDQSDLIDESSPALNEIASRLVQQPDAAFVQAEGWSVAVVDLRRVCSLQQTVAADDATNRVANIDPDDLISIANVTLPPPSSTQLSAQFDQTRNVWLISAATPNIRIAGQFNGELAPGVPGFGFGLNVMNSFVQVVRHHGRWVLRDGYHRAFGLLARGVTHAPVLVRDFSINDLGMAKGLFPTDVYLAERPPLLADFLDDRVAADADIPLAQRMIMVQGLELTRLG